MLSLNLTWSEDKNHLLKRQRGVAFEDVFIGVHRGDIFRIIFGHSLERHPGQDLLLIMIRDYLYAVPYERVGDTIRLTTIYPDGGCMTSYGLRRSLSVCAKYI